MLHDIEPRTFDNHFMNRSPQPNDLFLSYDGDTVLVREDKDKLWYPSFSDFAEEYPALIDTARFLFCIDQLNYFLVDEKGLDGIPGWKYVSNARFRTESKYWRSLAGAVGAQLSRWYESHRFCSKCGSNLVRSEKERMLSCESCGFLVYPTISPCVIVGIHSGNRLLLTKYAGRAYTRYALVAGFVEIGESLEQAASREVMEEVGLKIKNLQFYKSQPWPFSDSLLSGFFAELDGDDTITLDQEELSLGVWMNRDEIPPDESKISLTGAMMEAFRTGVIR